jgi:single-strand DNA-binding protein
LGTAQRATRPDEVKSEAKAGTSKRASPRKPTVPAAAEIGVGHRNEVVVAGRLAAAATAKLLPSGDQLVSWRLIIDRAGPGGTRKIDVVECTAFLARVRRAAVRWEPGEVIEVRGALRRRFWRGPAGGPQSRYHVEVETATRVPIGRD